jgi:hypothetical protein
VRAARSGAPSTPRSSSRRLAAPPAGLVAIVAVFAGLLVSGHASAATRLLAVGDYGVGGASQLATGKAMKRFERRYPAELLVTLGDNDYTASPSAFRRNFRAAFGWLGESGVGIAGTLGNHDYAVDDGAYQLATLGMPARYYTRRIGEAEIFLLDSNRVTTAQTTWLRRRLAASTARWKIAVFHHPPYVCGYHAGDDRIESRTATSASSPAAASRMSCTAAAARSPTRRCPARPGTRPARRPGSASASSRSS